ncbi:nudix hydrolase 15, mitochondrial-like isoform X1 [Pistacia vera]|uniref:nudix hydrolase 15, mitochondrial-like isoform X1 n=1 Tax=Pistacia vera TaxID=55513 RepID=UPI001263A23F|nr:nudix hydrolase 15, mitochondrial-like isoform X1 [Pistacia vera]
MNSEMGCIKEENCGSQTLQKLAEQLYSYKSPSVSASEEEESKYCDIIGSNFGYMESLVVPNEHCCSCVNWRKKRAAVLICLFEGHEGELRVILTKRSMKLSSYPGDVALPGGKMEEGDEDDSATALREAMEEIGLDSELVQIVANFEPFDSQVQFLSFVYFFGVQNLNFRMDFMQNQLKVVPVIGLLSRIEDFNPVLNADEVDAIFDAPLEMFLKGDNHRIEEREWMGWKYLLHDFRFKSKQGAAFHICGLTASILIRAASVIYQKAPDFEHEHLPDFQQLQKTLNNMA